MMRNLLQKLSAVFGQFTSKGPDLSGPIGGKLVHRNPERFAHLLDETKGEIEGDENDLDRDFVFDLNASETGIMVLYASDKDRLGADDINHIKQVLSVIAEMDAASCSWPEDGSLNDIWPWLYLVAIKGRRVLLRYHSQKVNSEWDIKVEFDGPENWRFVPSGDT